MKNWIIEPQDPVIFRDGRPFDATPGAKAKSLPFPFPSTVAGAVRTRAGLHAGMTFNKEECASLLEQTICGPLLLQMDRQGEKEWFFPAPADALVLRQENHREEEAYLVPLGVVSSAEECWSNLPDGLSLLAPVEYINRKQHPKAPAFWNWRKLKTWLERPQTADITLHEWGLHGLPTEGRMHVSIDNSTGSAIEGALFRTSGLEFRANINAEGSETAALHQSNQFGLWLATDAELGEGVGFLGGERRTVLWRSGSNAPDCPPAVRNTITAQKHCRLLLATPGNFEGYIPQWLKSEFPQLEISVRAIAMPRYQSVSGWDLKEKQPKPSSRLVPAGTVYFLRLDGSDEAVGDFVDNVWLSNVSNDEQARRNGYGLALLGAWDGKEQPLNYQEETQS